MIFIGHTQFSLDIYRQDTRFRAFKRMTEDEYRTWLYGDERMTARLDIFLKESIPQLSLAQRGHEVHHVISFSPSLPLQYKEQLHLTAEQNSFIVLNETEEVVRPQLPPDDVCRSILRTKDGNVKFGAYRLDDDDLVSADYFDRMASHMDAAPVGNWVSLGAGYSLLRSRGQYYYARDSHYRMIAIGLLAVCERTDQGTVIGPQTQVPHDKTDTAYPVILDSREPAFVRTHHKTNDSLLRFDTEFLFSAYRMMYKKPPSSLRDLDEKFPVLAGKVSASFGDPRDRIDLITDRVEVSDSPIMLASHHEGGCILEVVPSKPSALERGQLVVSLRLDQSAAGEANHLAEHLRAFGFKKNNRYGWHSYFSHFELGSSKHMIISVPEQFEILGYELSSTSTGVFLDSVHAYPLLSTTATEGPAE